MERKTLIFGIPIVVAIVLAGCATPMGGKVEQAVQTINVPTKIVPMATGFQRWYLHLIPKIHPYPGYCEYYIEAKVTKDTPDGPPWDVLDISVGSDRGWVENKTCHNTSSCSVSERRYNLSCPGVCMSAYARDAQSESRLPSRGSAC